MQHAFGMGGPSHAAGPPHSLADVDDDNDVLSFKEVVAQSDMSKHGASKDGKSSAAFHDVIRHLSNAEAAQRPPHGGSPSRQTMVEEQGEKEEFAQDVIRLKTRYTQDNRGFLNPRSARMQRWDLTTGACMLFTAFVTPFEVGVGIPTSFGALFIVNQFVNIVFTIDIVLQFFLPVPDPRPENFGELIRDHKKIALIYCKSWFILDLMSVLPFDVRGGPHAQPSRHEHTHTQGRDRR
jgi:hypothetical protein